MILIAPAPPQHTPATSLRDAADVCLAVAVDDHQGDLAHQCHFRRKVNNIVVLRFVSNLFFVPLFQRLHQLHPYSVLYNNCLVVYNLLRVYHIILVVEFHDTDLFDLLGRVFGCLCVMYVCFRLPNV